MASVTTDLGERVPLAPTARFARLDPGRSFVHPLFDYLVIGGGLSLAFFAYLKLGGEGPRVFLNQHLWTLVLLSTSAHFAGSTVRLYTKADSFRDLRFLTMGLPLVTVGVLTLALRFSSDLGRHLQALYLTWSPYHYSAQTYGLAVMYCYRSGRAWTQWDTRWLRAACVLPFLSVFIGAGSSGLSWLLPPSVLELPSIQSSRSALVPALGLLGFMLPLALFVHHQTRSREGLRGLPLISLLLMLSNAVWLVSMPSMGALAMSAVAIFHGLQYLAILSIFHVKERLRTPGNGRPWWYHVGWFYLSCLVLGYLLFQVWPQAYVMAGFTLTESVLLVAAVINIHHFIVDAYIWRLRKDPNYQIVTAPA